MLAGKRCIRHSKTSHVNNLVTPASSHWASRMHRHVITMEAVRLNDQMEYLERGITAGGAAAAGITSGQKPNGCTTT